jgi:rubrerythrin
MSLRTAFEAALGAEVKAHEYYSEALEYVSDETVAELLRQLRQAELDHQKWIERELAKLA